MANVNTEFKNSDCCDQTIETTAAKLTAICNEIERLITYTEAELDKMYANKLVTQFQNRLNNQIQRVVCIRNEVITARDNITMLKVKIEAVQTDINNFHLKNLKNIKAQEKKKKAELKRFRANRNRLNELQADARSKPIVQASEKQPASTRSQTNGDIVLHLRPIASDSDADSNESIPSSTWTSGESRVAQNGSFTSIIRLDFSPYSRVHRSQ